MEETIKREVKVLADTLATMGDGCENTDWYELLDKLFDEVSDYAKKKNIYIG